MDALERVHWTRDQIFQTGALNVAELVERMTGVRNLRSGFILAPQVVTWWGETGRMRVFVDGVEHEVMNPREGRVQDLGAIATWNLEEVIAERTAAELRIHLRTWRVSRTTSESRVDVLTGDEETNLYRGFFGRRFQSGLGLQFAFQQFSTIAGRGGDGDALGLFARAGWARGSLSIDISTFRSGQTRTTTIQIDPAQTVPAFTGARASSMLRAGLGSPDTSRAWAQITASAITFDETSPRLTSGAILDSVDTAAYRAQYVASAGLARGGARASIAVRYRRFDHAGFLTPIARAELRAGPIHAQGYAERNTLDSTNRADASLRIGVRDWLAFTVLGSMRDPFETPFADAAITATVEASLRLGAYWATAGATRRDEAVADAPDVFQRGIIAATLPEAIGTTFHIAGPVYRAIRADVRGVYWEGDEYYRPQIEVRGQLGIETDWRSRFPRGDFTIRAYATLDHTARTFIPLSSGAAPLVPANVLSTLLEIRIKRATITWQFRNLLGNDYETVPGYRMPALLNLYGVRWNFVN